MARMTGGLPSFPLLVLVTLLPFAVRANGMSPTQDLGLLFDWSTAVVPLALVGVFILHVLAAPARLYSDAQARIASSDEKGDTELEQIGAMADLTARAQHGYKLLVRWRAGATLDEKAGARNEALGCWLLDVRTALSPYGPGVQARFNIPAVKKGVNETDEHEARVDELVKIANEIGSGQLSRLGTLSIPPADKYWLDGPGKSEPET